MSALEEKKKKEEQAKRVERLKGKAKYVFRNIENPGRAISPSYSFFGEPVETPENGYEDGKVYEIPRVLAMYINNNCAYPVAKNAIDDKGRPKVVTGSKIQRFRFEALDPFLMEEDAFINEKAIISIESV